MDLGSHETQGTHDTPVHTRAVATFNRACEAEIDDFDVVHFVEEDVLALQVSVRETLSVDVVNRLDQLLRVVTHNALIEGARVGYVVEELTTVDKLADDVGDLDLLAILFLPDGVLVEFVILDDVLVVEGLHRLNLVLQQLEGPLAELWVIQTEDFDGKFLALRVGAKFDFGAEAGAKGAAESVLSNCGGHFSLFLC